MRQCKKTALNVILLAAVAFVLLVASGLQSRSLRAERHGALGQDNAGYSADVPPMITFVSVALGGFRGVIADLLWLRVSKMQEEQRFVELVQLSDWITKLEPHMAEVWVFHAWNMSYNVSVLMSRPEDKWRWVQNGIELLRDEGLVLNPRNATLHRELGWIFQHKLGMEGDSASWYYRREWARYVSAYLGEDGGIPDDEGILASELEASLKMDTSAMAEIEAEFGKIDWRMPTAHSLYWGWKGLKLAGDNERLPCRRMVYTSLMEMARRNGMLVGDLTPEYAEFRARPNTALINPTLKFIEETMAMHDFSGIRFAYMGLLREGMQIRMAEDQEAEARRLYAKMIEFFKGKTERQLPTFENLLRASDDVYESMMGAAGFH